MPVLTPRPGDVLVYGAGPKVGHCAILSAVPGATAADVLAGAAVLDEARRWVGRGRYKLGAGGRRPGDGTPLDEHGCCDCSGFVCHCVGIDRLDPASSRWWNTDSIEHDGRRPGGRWEPVPIGAVDLRRCLAIHCRQGTYPAIVETTAALWRRRGGIVCRYVPPL